MSSARFTSLFWTSISPAPDMDPGAVVQASVASASMISKALPAVPSRHYIWIYDISGVKSDVIA